MRRLPQIIPGQSEQWAYTPSLGWVYTGANTYPWMFVPQSQFGSNKWLRYGFGRVGGRWFYVVGEGWRLEK